MRISVRAAIAAGCLLSALVASAQTVLPMPQRGSFALVGDVPFGVADEPKFDRVIEAVNATPRVSDQQIRPGGKG